MVAHEGAKVALAGEHGPHRTELSVQPRLDFPGQDGIPVIEIFEEI